MRPLNSSSQRYAYFRQLVDIGFPAPLNLGQFQRIGRPQSHGRFRSFRNIQCNIIQALITKSSCGLYPVAGVNINRVKGYCQPKHSQPCLTKPNHKRSFVGWCFSNTLRTRSISIFSFSVYSIFMSSLAKSFGVYHHQFSTRRLALSAGHICCISFLSIRLILSLMVSVLVSLKWTRTL